MTARHAAKRSPDGIPYYVPKSVNGDGWALLAIAVVLILTGLGFFIYGTAEGQNTQGIGGLDAFASSEIHQAIGVGIFALGFLSMLLFLTAEAIRR